MEKKTVKSVKRTAVPEAGSGNCPAPDYLNNLVTRYYFAKLAAERAEELRNRLRDELISSGLREIKAENGLSLTVSSRRGRKVFSPEKAFLFLKEKLGARKANQICTSVRIIPKHGKVPPDSLMKQIDEYFDTESVLTVTAETVHNAGTFEDSEVSERCYTFGSDSFSVGTDTSVDLGTLAEITGIKLFAAADRMLTYEQKQAAVS